MWKFSVQNHIVDHEVHCHLSIHINIHRECIKLSQIMCLKCNALLINKNNLPILHIGKTLRDVPTTNSKSNSYCSKAATHNKDLPFSKNDNASESVVAQCSGTLEIKGLSHRSVVSSFVDVPAYPLLLKDNAGKEPCYMRQETRAVNILQTQGHFKKCCCPQKCIK